MARYVTPEDYDPRQRFVLYRLCDCSACEGRGKVGRGGRIGPGAGLVRCFQCRGEGRIRQEVASCESPEAVGVALVTLGREGEWEDCPFGLLDREGEKGKKWIILPWLPSPRNVSDAGRVLRGARK